MANPTATPATRDVAGKQSKGQRGISRKDIPPPTGAFALPPPKPKYYEDNGLRKVKPYIDAEHLAGRYAFNAFAKERWQNRTLLDMYQWAIETGVIVVNNQKSTADRLIRNGDLISNVLHRHEPPVVAGPIKIIYDGRLPGNDGETLVVEKPGSMPVHPTGRYNFNTLLEILKYDYDLPLVHTSNRLDRLTSGVMVCALTVDASKKLGAWFGGRRKEGGVSKEYVARCVGRFPDGEIVCEEPLLTIDRQIGVNVVHPEGRDSKTIFTRLSYDERSNTSVVHLQFLGHSIANDPIYQNMAAWGETGGKGGVFGSARGGTQEDKEERRERGDMFLAAQLAKEQGDAAADEGAAPTPQPTPSRFNRNGDLRLDGQYNTPTASSSSSSAALSSSAAETPISPADAADLDRKPHDPLLSAGAARAITALREVRDKSDGHARTRDMEGIELARKELVGGKNKMSIDAQFGEVEGAGEGGEGEAEEVIEGEEIGKEGGFCGTCFTPLLPDPKPEQLFIWLHAMRYSTAEWDWKSELPYWAEASYGVPLSSILA
ncbi:hypothetical protein JCM10213v2_000080 [Rhodosporidiobolus nylandii]